MLRLYNTETRSVDEFQPIEPGKVRLYTCGPTVYNYAHVGNLRTYVFEDVLKRALKFADPANPYDVRHVMNVTDVGHLVSDADEGEDKMVLAMRREGRSAHDIADFYWQAFRSDLARLNILEPDVWCKATDHIAEQIATVRTLEAKGYTYVIEGDGVYFDTSKYPDYGRMARLDVSGLRAGARIELAAGKRKATDFALWKFSPADQKRLMEWDSPWGMGFPGWHIECSAMAIAHLGERLDIHCGGIDHVQVHHTNEIAQAECALGHTWCNWWMHGEFLTFPRGADAEAAKMSKSSGEFLTLDRVLEEGKSRGFANGYDPLAFRYLCFNAHYRQQLAFTWEAMDSAQLSLDALRSQVLSLKPPENPPPELCDQGVVIEAHFSIFREAVENDLNMPQAMAAVWGLLRDPDIASPPNQYATLLEMDKVLGLGIEQMKPPDEHRLTDAQREAVVAIARRYDEQSSPREDNDDVQWHIDVTHADVLVERLIQLRAQAREGRNFELADEIRQSLAENGIRLKDSPDGPKWQTT